MNEKHTVNSASPKMSLRFTEDEYREFLRRGGMQMPKAPLQTENKRTKYGNKKVEIDGKKFDSMHEAEYYRELTLRRAAGEVKVIMRQVPFDLPGGVRYFADFAILDKEGKFIVIDAKSEATRKDKVYRIKKKQMKEIWGIEVIEV